MAALWSILPLELRAAAPSIVSPPQSQTVAAGANVAFNVTAGGDAPLSYEWWREFGPLVPAQTNATLTLSAVELTDAGNYRVVVRNAAGSVTSAAATLTVNPPAGAEGENFLWARKAGSAGVDPGANLAVDSAGNSYLVGSFTGSVTIGGTTLTSSGGSDVFVAKFSRGGTLLWVRKAGGVSDDFGCGIAVDPFGNVHITGAFGGSADFNGTMLTSRGGTDVFVARYNRSGDLLWARTAGGTGADRAYRIAADAAGNSYVIGSFAGSANFGSASVTSAGGDDVFLAKFSSSGVALWARRFGGSNADAGTSLSLGAESVFIAGRFRGPADFGSVTLSDGGATEVFIAKCNSAGTVLWAKRANGVDTTAGGSVVVGDDGASYLAGTFSGPAAFGVMTLTNREPNDRFVANYDANGNIIWAARAGALTGQGTALGIQSTDGGSVSAFASGGADFSGGVGSGADLVVARFSAPNTLVWGKQSGADYASFSVGHSADGLGNHYLVGLFEDLMGGTNDPGYSLSHILLAKSSPPQPPLIVLQPQSRTIAPGASASFAVTATAPAALSYQWRFNGADIAGANSATYTISSAQAGNQGVYQVVVWNVDGSATSTEASLAIQTPVDTTVPTIAFSSPAANARFTNATITLQGTASDNASVDRVEYRLNSGPFQVASGTSNWFASVTLAPGTNLVELRSTDNAGNSSAVASRSFVYAPVSPLTISIAGAGTVTPDLNGQLLEIGASYSITAVPAAGYAFSSWSGDMTSPNTILTFAMRSNLRLQANFTDASAPTVAFAAPAANARFTNASISVQGTASDNVGVARVECQLNSGPFVTASGTANWSANVTLVPGTNTVRVRSTDNFGLTSSLVSRSFIYAPVSPLSVVINGNGSVTPNLSGQLLEIGAAYTVTAVPATGFKFAGWSGGITNTNVTVTFEMRANLTLVASFSDGTAPTVAFTAPSADTRFTNANISIQGVASDNVAVARVEYQVNSGSFLAASGSTTWSAAITLAPGTNVVRVRSVDNLGNTSATISRSFVYAPANALIAIVHGRGSITPDLNGQFLEIGRTYTVTAVPAAGALFVNWTGGVVGENPVLTFTMHSGLIIEANFQDVAPPTIAFTSPAPNARLADPVLTITGTASDDTRVDRVEYQLGDGPFQIATGTTNWSVTLILSPGANVVGVRSIDDSGAVSPIVTRSFVYAPTAPLSLAVQGNGSVTPDLNSQLLEIGASYTITARPAAGFVFSRWSGDVSGANAVLTFQMQAGLNITAIFTTSGLTNANTNGLALARGLYSGLFYEADGVQHHSSGFLTLTATERGSYTSSMRAQGRTFAMSGRFSTDGKATNVIRRGGTNAFIVQFQLPPEGAETLQGQITDGNWTAYFLGEKMTFNARTNPAPYAGKYTLIIPGNTDASVSPGGDGFATVSVSASGYASLSGTLGDASATVSQRVPLSKDGLWPLYVPLYNGKGSLLSWMHFAGRASDDVNGLLSWLKPNLSSTKFYPGGFTNQTYAIGSLYVVPTTRTNRLLNISNAVIELSGANLAAPFAADVLLSPTNKIIGVSGPRVTMSFRLSSGLFSGSALDPSTGKQVPFKGAVLQKANFGSGLHSGTNRTGRVVFSRRKVIESRDQDLDR